MIVYHTLNLRQKIFKLFFSFCFIRLNSKIATKIKAIIYIIKISIFSRLKFNRREYLWNLSVKYGIISGIKKDIFIYFSSPKVG
jgi:hypothetical protein